MYILATCWTLQTESSLEQWSGRWSFISSGKRDGTRQQAGGAASADDVAVDRRADDHSSRLNMHSSSSSCRFSWGTPERFDAIEPLLGVLGIGLSTEFSS